MGQPVPADSKPAGSASGIKKSFAGTKGFLLNFVNIVISDF